MLCLPCRGGVPIGGITEVVGPAGVGKSQLCHTLTVAALVAELDAGQVRQDHPPNA